MNEKELLQFRCIMREIELLSDEITRIECDMKEMSVSGETVQASSTEYPFIFHSVGVSGLAGSEESRALCLLLADRNAQLKAERKKYIAEYEKIERFVASVSDVALRRIVIYRYVEGKSFITIAAMLGGEWTADGVRMRLRRFLQKSKKDILPKGETKCT